MSLQCFTHDDTKLLCMGVIPYICGLLTLILQNTLLDLVLRPHGSLHYSEISNPFVMQTTRACI
jgi:hypothetical protein